jgi:hypothetical protein
MPMPTFGYPSGSIRRIRIPPPITISVVDVTMTLAARRTESGSRRNGVTRRSSRFRRSIREPGLDRDHDPNARGG